MSISNNYVPVNQSGDGVTASFGALWNVIAASYLQVFWEDKTTKVQTQKTLGTNFTLVFTSTGFTVTFLPAFIPPNTVNVIIGRSVSKDQIVAYKTSQGFQGAVEENSFDKVTAITQDLQEQVNRSLRFQLGTAATNYVIQDPIQDRALKWDVANNKIVNSQFDPDIGAASAAASAATATTQAGIATDQASTATTQAGIATDQAALAQSWAVGLIGVRPEGSAKYWAQQAASSQPGLVKISAGDTTGGYLIAKLVAGSAAITLTKQNAGANETLQIDAPGLQPIAPREQTVASAATVTPTSANDIVTITAQAAGLTIANPTGVMSQGQALVIRIKDNGTARSIAFGANYRALGVTLPTTTVISKTLYLYAIWNNTDTKFDVTGTAQEA